MFRISGTNMSDKHMWYVWTLFWLIKKRINSNEQVWSAGTISSYYGSYDHLHVHIFWFMPTH